MQVIKMMFRPLGLIFLGLAAMTPAFAVDVIYSTTGVFNGCIGAGFTCAGNTLTGPNGLSITFTGTPADAVANVEVPDTSYAPFGTFTVVGPKCPAANPNCNVKLLSDTVNAHFTLTVNQTAPSVGVETLNDKIFGSIRIANSQVTLTFQASGPPSATPAVNNPDPINGQPSLNFNIGNVTYWVDIQTPLHPQTAGGTPGSSIINGAIDATVPEPTFYALTGAGFLSLFAMAIRRRRQNAAPQE